MPTVPGAADIISACDNGKQMATVTNVLIGVTAVAAIAAGYFYYKGYVASPEGKSDQARAKGGLAAAPSSGAKAAAATPPTDAKPASEGPRLTVRVSLAPELAAQVAPDDVLFVFAKAASGPPMPLAVQRLRAADLPATVVLTDGMGMMPSMTLSQFPQVVVGARISKSGNAIAQPGDLQAVSAPLDVKRNEPVILRIDRSVP